MNKHKFNSALLRYARKLFPTSSTLDPAQAPRFSTLASWPPTRIEDQFAPLPAGWERYRSRKGKWWAFQKGLAMTSHEIEVRNLPLPSARAFFQARSMTGSEMIPYLLKLGFALRYRVVVMTSNEDPLAPMILLGVQERRLRLLESSVGAHETLAQVASVTLVDEMGEWPAASKARIRHGLQEGLGSFNQSVTSSLDMRNLQVTFCVKAILPRSNQISLRGQKSGAPLIWTPAEDVLAAALEGNLCPSQAWLRHHGVTAVRSFAPSTASVIKRQFPA